MPSDIQKQINDADFEIARYRSIISKLKAEINTAQSEMMTQSIIKERLLEQLRRINMAIVPEEDPGGKLKQESIRFNEAYQIHKHNI